MYKKTVFITGGTGFIGCHLISRFLKSGYQVIALCRSKEGAPPRQRLLDAVLKVDPSIEINGSNFIDIAGAMDGDPDDWIRQIRARTRAEIDEVWHLAAIFKIRKQTQKEVEDININGVIRILHFVRNVNSCKAPRYFHVSTAYSQGRSFKVIQEKLYETGLEFRSLYDWSKNSGEREVSEYQKKYHLDAAILRPSIVVSSLGSKVVNNAAYYTVLETLYFVRKRAEISMGQNFDGDIGVRFWCEPGCRLNIVPVDFVVEGMYLLSQNQKLATNELKVFNIVNENPPALKMLFEIGSESLRIKGFDLVEKKAFEKEPMTPLERLFERRVGFQSPYVREQISFSMGNFRKIVGREILPTPVVDENFMRDINKNFIEVHERKLYSAGSPAVMRV